MRSMLYTRGSRFRSCISLTWRAARGRRQQVKSSAMGVTQSYSYWCLGLKDLKITESMWNQSNQPNQLNQSIIESKLWTNVRCHRRSLEGRCLLRFAGRFGFQKGGPKWLFWRCADQPLTFCLGKCDQCTYGEELGRLGIWVDDIMSSKQKLSGKPHQKRFSLRRSTRALPRLQIDTLTAGFSRRKLLHCPWPALKIEVIRRL